MKQGHPNVLRHARNCGWTCASTRKKLCDAGPSSARTHNAWLNSWQHVCSRLEATVLCNAGSFGTGLLYGGPVVCLWGWLLVCMLTLCQGLCMVGWELSSCVRLSVGRPVKLQGAGQQAIAMPLTQPCG